MPKQSNRPEQDNVPRQKVCLHHAWAAPTLIPPEVLDLLILSKSRTKLQVDFYFEKGLVNSTQRTYLSAKKVTFSFALNMILSHYLYQNNICANTACKSRSHIQDFANLLSISAPYTDCRGTTKHQDRNMPKLDQVMRQIKSHQARTMSGSQPCLPITPDILLKLRKV